MALGQRAERNALPLHGVLRPWAPRVQGTTPGAGQSPTFTIVYWVTSSVSCPPRVLQGETEAQEGGGTEKAGRWDLNSAVEARAPEYIACRVQGGEKGANIHQRSEPLTGPPGGISPSPSSGHGPPGVTQLARGCPWVQTQTG